MHIFQILTAKHLQLPDLALSNFRVRVVNTETLRSSLLRTENAIFRNKGPELDLGILEVLELALVLMRKNSLFILACR